MSVVYNVCVKMIESAWFFHLKMLVLFFFLLALSKVAHCFDVTH